MEENYRLKWIQMDPRNIEAIENMYFQETADEVCQFLHCSRWMSCCIPDFHLKSQSLSEILEDAYKQTGRRSKMDLKIIALHQLFEGAIH